MSEKRFRYFALRSGFEPVEVDRKSAVTQLECHGSLNGGWQIDNSTKENPVVSKFESFWREEVQQ